MIELVPGGTDVVGRVASWLLTYALHSTLLLGLAWWASRRNLGLHLRDAIWKSAVLGGLLTASLQQIAGPGPWGIVMNGRAEAEEAVTSLPAGPAPVLEVEPAVEAGDAAGIASLPPSNVTSREVVAAPAPHRRIRASWPELLVLLWAIGAGVGLLRYGWARLRLWALLRGRRPVGDPDLRPALDRLTASAGLRRPIRLTWCDQLVAPVALRREICLPKRALAELDLDQLRSMIAHELGHIVRRDATWLHLTFAIQRVLFMQPLNVVARRHLQEIAEFLCDELAVRYTGRKRSVAECLATVADWIHGSRRPIALPSMAHDGSQLVRRVQRILSSEGEASVFTTIPVRVLSGAMVIALVGITAPGFAWERPEPASVAPELGARSETPEPNRPAALPAAAGESAVSTLTDATDRRDKPVEADEPVVSARFDEPVAPAVPAAAVASPAPVAAQQTPSDTVDPRIVASLVEALQDDDATVRKEAAQALGNLRASSAVAPLARALADNEAEVRAYAAWALGRIRDLNALEPLVGALADDSVRVRRASARAIGAMINRQNRGTIDVQRLGATFGSLLTDEDPEIRASGINLIEELQLTTYAERLIPITTDSVADVRRMAVRVIGRFKPSGGVPALVRALDDSSGEVRRVAVVALAEYGTVESTRALRGAVSDSSANVRETAVRALGEARDSTSVSTLITAASDTDADVRVAALRALRRLQMPEAIPAYRTALQDPNADARALAVAGLSDLPDPSVLPALRSALDDSDADVREIALRALARVKDPSMISAVIPMLRDVDEDVRERAARVLGEVRNESAVAPLAAALSDSVADVREAALRSLVAYGSPATFDPMVQALSDPSDDVREVAAAGLGRLKDPRAVTSLRQVLANDGSSSVRQRTVSALSSIGGPTVVPAMIVALSDESSEVRAAAARALGELRDPRAVEPLMAALDDPATDVRRAAARALGRYGR